VETLEKPILKWDINIQPWSFVTLTLYSDDIDELALHLQKKLAQAPKFFKNTPIVLAFGEDKDCIEIGIMQKILSILERYELHLSGCSGPDSWVPSVADFFNIPYLTQKDAVAHHSSLKSQTIGEPLRAGQQFYATEDVIALAKTHSGSEVISQGNIHAYARAQGRLLAGVNGDHTSRIFCQALDTELLSIAGIFMTKSQIPPEYLGKQCMAYLENGKIIIQLIQKDLV
jgi:septum site-determining protein MinC